MSEILDKNCEVKLSQLNKEIENKPRIENARILLRQALTEDCDAYVSFVTQKHLTKFSPFSAATPEKAKNAFEMLMNNYDRKTYHFWSVLDKNTNQYAGFSGNHAVVCNGKMREMFFMRLLPEFSDINTLAQVAYLNCDYVFRNKSISEIIAFIHPYDTLGMQWAEQLNFKFEQESPFFGVTFFLFTLNKKELKRNPKFLEK